MAMIESYWIQWYSMELPQESQLVNRLTKPQGTTPSIWVDDNLYIYSLTLISDMSCSRTTVKMMSEGSSQEDLAGKNHHVWRLHELDFLQTLCWAGERTLIPAHSFGTNLVWESQMFHLWQSLHMPATQQSYILENTFYLIYRILWVWINHNSSSLNDWSIIRHTASDYITMMVIGRSSIAQVWYTCPNVETHQLAQNPSTLKMPPASWENPTYASLFGSNFCSFSAHDFKARLIHT